MDAKRSIRLAFEWGGGCLWPGDDEARSAFGFGPLESLLPITPAMHQRLSEMSSWHETSRDIDYAAFSQHPSAWTASEQNRFERMVVEVIAQLRTELGPSYEVFYLPR
jgi:hypothetical protein